MIKKLSRFKYILITVLAFNTLLVSTHLGEFWPFSIFPMFSQAGNPWSRAMVQRVDDTDKADLWETKPLRPSEAEAVSLKQYGIDQIDYANFISKTKDWNPKRIQALRDLLKIDQRPGERWMATQVKGYLTESDSVVIQSIPLFLLSADTTIKNPMIFSD